MTSNVKPAELRFIVKTGVGQVSSEERRAIRSHVMKGRNLGKERPLGSRWRRQLAGGEEDDRSPEPSSASSDASSRRGSASSPDASSSDSTTPTSEYSCSRDPSPSIPRSYGSASSTMRLADSVSPGSIEIVLRFSSIAKQLLFPMERCILFERRAENWIAPLAVDSAFLHAKIFTSLYYFDVILPRSSAPPSRRLIRHHHKALSLLRERLLNDRDDARLSDNTVSVVLGLAGQSFWFGDTSSAMQHMQGIKQIVRLRGGLCTFRGNEKLAVEILRCDLGIAAHTGLPPVFFDRTTSPFPNLTKFLDTNHLPFPTTTHPHRPSHANTPIPIPALAHNPELAQTWTALATFCAVINLADASAQRITVATFLESMAAVMYRLVRMRCRDDDSSPEEETVRLGLLCFACSVFLHWHHLGVPYPHLAREFRGVLARAGGVALAQPRVRLWLLAAGAVSVFEGGEDRRWVLAMLREAMGACGVRTWSEVREVLGGFMWIGLVHDRKGEAVVEAAVNAL